MSRVLARLRRQRATRLISEAQTFGPGAAPVSHSFPITTVSLNYNFDSYISVGFKGADAAEAPQLIVDSGNSSLIVPRWEDIAAIPNFRATYQSLGETYEPWGCPANIVKGPIELFDSQGESFTIEDCIFFACTADSPQSGERTYNFGTGCISPWSAAAGNVVASLAVTLQPVLSQTAFPYVLFDYEPMDSMQLASSTAAAASGSMMQLFAVPPEGFHMFEITPNCPWMSLVPKSLSIDGVLTRWPGALGSPIAMIDTGGGPVFLSDPDGYLYPNHWSDPVSNPGWASSSTLCQSTKAQLAMSIGDNADSYDYTIDPATFPGPVQGLTLVMCENNAYMMGERGMNIGGISALVNSILIDFKNNKVGFKRR